jgi:hypothetical protein
VAPLRSTERVLTFHQVWTYEQARGGSLRAWLGRASGRADRRLLFALAATTDSIASRCDELAERVVAQEALVADLAETYGAELARLRAEVEHLRKRPTPEQDDGTA